MLDVLLVEDEPSILALFSEALSSRGHRVVTATDGLSGLALLESRVFDVVISDVRLPRVNGLDLFHRARAKAPATRFIIMTAYATVEDAVNVMKEGAVDYFTKPVDLTELLALLDRIERELLVTRRFDKVRTEPKPDARLIGRSPAMTRLIELLNRFAAAHDPVLITGESGTGKELAARELHRVSHRTEAPFVAINCATLSDGAFDAEPFVAPAGKRNAAAKPAGTLFLDEVAELSPSAQTLLLKWVEEHGENADASSPRLVSATHRNLRALVAEGRFREDLYFRLKVLELPVPPLRDRGGDLMVLLDHFVRRLAAPHPPEISARALAAFTQYPFPGNVRELEHAVRYALTLSAGAEIDLPHLPEEIAGPAAPRPGPSPRSLPEAVREFEREYLRRAMLRSQTSRRASVAEALGISRKNLWEKIRGYGLTGEIDADGNPTPSTPVPAVTPPK